MAQTQARLLRVAAARADFLETGREAADAVPDVVAASWVRSRQAGVDADRALPHESEDVDTGSRLVRCAKPVLDQLGADTADLPLIIALTDSRARIVQRLDSSPGRPPAGPGQPRSRVRLRRGHDGHQRGRHRPRVGQAVCVVGPEHFTENLQVFACTGAPIIDPLTGRLEGILDISMRARPGAR